MKFDSIDCCSILKDHLPNLRLAIENALHSPLNRRWFCYGGVAQLGEHLPCKQGVMGSNPIISTSGLDGERTAQTNGLIAQQVRARA